MFKRITKEKLIQSFLSINSSFGWEEKLSKICYEHFFKSHATETYKHTKRNISAVNNQMKIRKLVTENNCTIFLF